MLHERTKMRKSLSAKGMLSFLLCYLIWGFQPLYFIMLDGMDTLFIMANRIVWAAVCCTAILRFRGDLSDMLALFRSRHVMTRIVPSSLFLFADWIIYLIAVRNGKVQECSLGYYIMPLVMFAFGTVIYKEKMTWQKAVVLVIVVIGILLSINGFGTVPYVTISLALCFAIYSAIKKSIDVDSVVSTTAEIVLMVPLALIYIIVFCRNDTGLYSLTFSKFLLLLGSGAVTGLPMLFFAVGIKYVPLTTAGMFQYLSPTLGLFCSVIMGESITKEKIISFAFIWAGIILYTIITIHAGKGKEEIQSCP